MRWFDANGKQLRYEIRHGRAPYLVLIHEMGGSIESWDLVMDTLPPEQGVVLPEMRGMGVSERVNAPLRFSDIAADVAALLDHCQIMGPVILSGCAIGGGIALQFALDYPTRTAAVVPLDPALGTTPEGANGVRKLADLMAAEGMAAVEETLLAKTYPDRYRERNPGHFAAVRGRWYANDPVSFAYYFRMLADTDLVPQLGAIRCPVLFGAGLYDSFRPPAYVRYVADAVAGSRVVELDAGHHVPDHAPEAVCLLLQEALAVAS